MNKVRSGEAVKQMVGLDEGKELVSLPSPCLLLMAMLS
jgi:hypothetical protein